MFCSCYDHQTEGDAGRLVWAQIKALAVSGQGNEMRFDQPATSVLFQASVCVLLTLSRLGVGRVNDALSCLAVTGSNQAYRAISTSQLNALLHLHLWPIDVVVFHGPQGDLVLKGASRLDAFSGYPVRT